MKKKSVKYSEGDLFLIELKNDQKILGIIARRYGKTKLLLGFFWKYNFLITDDYILKKQDAILITKFGGLGFELSDWQVLGKYEHWHREDFGFPEFKRYDTIRDTFFAVSYNESFEQTSLRPISTEQSKAFFEDGSHGHISLENYLLKITS